MSKNIWNEKDLSTTELEYFKSFYYSHSLKETQEHFGISQSAIYKRLEKYNIPRSKVETVEACLARIDKETFEQYYLNHTRANTCKHFNVGDTMLGKILRHYGLTKGRVTNEELSKIISKTELEEYYLAHTLEETENYFNQKYELATQHRIISLLDYYKIDKLNNSKQRIIEYLATVEKTSLHELAKALNLGYCNVTHLVKQLDLEDKIQYTPTGSSYENDVEAFLQQYNINYIKQSRQVLKNGLELDFYLPDCDIGIEVNGAYWHSSLFKEKTYHLEKSKVAAEQGIRLIHIWDYEWDDPSIQLKIKNVIKTAIGLSDKKIFARACLVKELNKSEAKNFLEEYHLQGNRSAKINLGLFHKNELVQVITFDNTKYNKNLNSENDWEIIRECSKADYIIVGGKAKLFKHFIKQYKPTKVFSYCDFNKFTGNSYLKLGMTFTGYSGPDMKWLMPNGHVKNRNPKKNQELKEQAQAKIFGCGSLKYVYKRAD